MNLEEPRESMEWSAGAMNAEPGNPLFKATMALALAQTGEREKALALLDETLQTLPPGDPLYGEITALRDRIASESF